MQSPKNIHSQILFKLIVNENFKKYFYKFDKKICKIFL